MKSAPLCKLLPLALALVGSAGCMAAQGNGGDGVEQSTKKLGDESDVDGGIVSPGGDGDMVDPGFIDIKEPLQSALPFRTIFRDTDAIPVKVTVTPGTGRAIERFQVELTPKGVVGGKTTVFDSANGGSLIDYEGTLHLHPGTYYLDAWDYYVDQGRSDQAQREFDVVKPPYITLGVGDASKGFLISKRLCASNVAVKRVDFYKNGVLTSSSTKPPFVGAIQSDVAYRAKARLTCADGTTAMSTEIQAPASEGAHPPTDR